MQKTMALGSLNTFQRNICSQYGEDGIIEEILSRFGGASGLDDWCVKFGAWDGVYLSNTCNLIKNKNGQNAKQYTCQ
jgi:hypothetical protein